MQLTPFNFKDIRLRESCWINKNPYFTGRAIGIWLEARHPDRYVHKIVERNPHIKQFATFVNLTIVDEYPKGHSLVNLTNEYTERRREVKVRVYDPIGLQLIVFESRQKKAIQFKIAAAHLVWAFMNGKLISRPFDPDLDEIAYTPKYDRKRSNAIKRLAGKYGVSYETIRVHSEKYKNGEPLNKKNCVRGKQCFVHKKYRDKYHEAIRLRQEECLTGIEIARKLNIPDKTVYHWFTKISLN